MKATGLLMLLCALMTGLAHGQRDPLELLRWGALSPALVGSGQIWRVGSWLFVQDGPPALLLALLSLGYLGRARPAREVLGAFAAGGLAGALAVSSFSTGAGAGIFALLGMALVRARPGSLVALLFLNVGAAALWQTWRESLAGFLVGLVLGAVTRRRDPPPAACAAVAALPLAALLPALLFGFGYRGVESYPTRSFRNERWQVEYCALLTPREDASAQAVAFSGPGIQLFVAQETAHRQVSARQLGTDLPAHLSQSLQVTANEEDSSSVRIWQRLTLGKPPRGVLLRTGQGLQLYTLGLFVGPRTALPAAQPLLSQLEDSFQLSAPPNDVRAQYAFEEAMSLLAQGQLPQAVAGLTKALAEQPRLAEALFQRGFLQAQLGQPERALADYAAALELDPRDPRPYLNRAILRIEQNQMADARPDLDRALELASAQESGIAFEAWNARGWVRIHLGDPAGGLQDADAALALRPVASVAAQAHDTRGFALEALKRYPEAQAAYSQAMEHKLPDAFLHAGELHLRQGETATARPLLEQFMKLAPQRPEVARVRRELR